MKPPEPWSLMLRKAKADLALAETLLDNPSVTDEHIGFFCQQAVEKAIKAVLSERSIRYRRTHDIWELLELVKANSIPYPESLPDCVALTPFAVEFRYDELPTTDTDLSDVFHRAEAVRSAKAAVAWAESSLKKD